ncbi:MAG TPA: FAD:protein FMN transferase [Kineosporiaceae bacterium]|nr:FAD:protein FMN transferase [Kineosporiaceae bacterium]
MTDPAQLPELPPDPTDPTDPPDADLPRRAWVEQVMGMPVSIHVRGPLARDGAEQAVARAIADLHRTDDIFSTYRFDSQISRLRRGELPLASCDSWVLEVARLCDHARSITDGWFEAHLPGPDGVRAFDPTGLVKGWSIARACERLSGDLPEHDVLVNAGGDIAVRCRRTDTPDWQLGIENPADRTQVLATVGLRTGGMATSGTAARGAHIVDPATGRPATDLLSVTVIGPDLLWADVQATAAFAMGPACVQHLAALADHLGFVVFLDGTTTTVTGKAPPP